MPNPHGPNPSPSKLVEPLEPRTLLAAVKIMPLGDSITEGFDGSATYRYYLWQQLRAAGYDVDFVGSKRGVANGTPRFGDFDQDHEAHAGWRADQLLSRIGSVVQTYRPDIVLVHAGTNDIAQRQSDSSTVAELGQIIDRLRDANPRVAVLLAQIIPASRLDPRGLNEQIAALAAAKHTSDSPVLLVDHYSGFDPVEDLYDGIHPDASGEQKMAGRWMTALSSLLSPAPPPPPPPPVDRNPFLSDLPVRVVNNGNGPVERNRSSGGPLAGDGRTIKLNNALYRRGFGVWANADIRFNLDGKYGKFTVDAGVDDEVGNHAGSVVFRIFVDNAKVYDSGPVYGRTGTKSVILNVTGGRELRLLVIDKGDGNAGDSAVWANPRLFGLLPPSGGTNGTNGGGGGGDGTGGGSPGSGSSGGGRMTNALNPFARGERGEQTIERRLWEQLIEPSSA